MQEDIKGDINNMQGDIKLILKKMKIKNKSIKSGLTIEDIPKIFI